MHGDRIQRERTISTRRLFAVIANRRISLAAMSCTMILCSRMFLTTAVATASDQRTPPVASESLETNPAMPRDDHAAPHTAASPRLMPPSNHFRAQRQGEQRTFRWPVLPARLDLRLAVFIALAGGWLWWLTHRAARQRLVVPPGAVEICGRVPLDNKQSLHFVRIGQRILVLLQSAQGVQRVTEITDADEVRNLLESSGTVEPGAPSVVGGRDKSHWPTLATRLESWS